MKPKKVVFDGSRKQSFDTLRKPTTILLSAFALSEVCSGSACA